MSEAVIRAEGVSFAYTAGMPVLCGVSFSVRSGERVGLVGATGAGKSTLLLLLAGVMAPGGGSLTVDGVGSRRERLGELRRHVGLVFQNPEDMLFMPTVAADVAFGPERLGLGPGEVERRLSRCLSATGTSALAARPPWALSGGEKRAVSIAAVLALEPSVLLLDEPSSGLDPASRRSLVSLVHSIPGTVFVASHDLDLVLDVCDRVLVLGGRTVTADGPATEILCNRSLLLANRLDLPLRLQACPRCAGESARVTCGEEPGAPR